MLQKQLRDRIVVGGALAWVVVNAPGWSEVQTDFVNGPIFWASLPGLVGAFGTKPVATFFSMSVRTAS